MRVKRSKYSNGKSVSIKKILVLSVLFISFLLIAFVDNLNINQNFNDNEKNHNKEENIVVENLKTQDLTSENNYTGVGSAWNVTHYAYQTKTNLEVSFNNDSYNAEQQIKLDSGWIGYQLNSTIKNLYITRNLVNGTFHCGNDDGYTKGDDDSNLVLNWTFGELDGAQSNTMEGNYYDGIGDGTDGADCLELRIHEDSYGYDTGDKCWWISDFTIPQEEIEEASIYLAVNPKYADQDAGHFTFRIKVNDITVMSRNLYSLYDVSGNAWNNEEETIDNIEEVFPIGVNNANITLEFERTGGSYGGYGIPSYGVLVDNVTLVLKAKAKPTELELKLNDIQINDDAVNIGEGYLEILSTWNGSEQSAVIANFSSNINWPLVFNDGGNLRSYKIELETNLTLYINKSTPESYYTADPDLSYQGSTFVVSNNSNVNWTTYAHMEIPIGYEETNMTIDYPLDVNLTGLFFSLNPDSLSQTSIKEYGNKKVVNIPVSSITGNTNGFWKLTAVSPNYCKQMGIYNNVTGDWELNNEFLSGEYINITVKINNSQLISGYIQQTKAQLQIAFPNGTIWSTQNQIKPVDDTGMVYFDPIMIPDDIPDYIAGEYEAIITWNNSYSSFGSNETGIIYKKFIVIHDSLLYPDQGIFFIENVIDDRVINIKVSFRDLIDGTAIENAQVYTDFTGVDETLSQTSPGFYLYEFNATQANAGNNTVTIYANSTYYSNKIINITVEVIKQTILSVETYDFTVPWKQNFTVQFNYTEKNNPQNGIDTTNITIDEWLGDYHLTQPSIGQYELECNTSAYAALTLQSFIISINPYKYEPQSVLIRVSITELASSLTLFLNSDPKNDGDTIQVYTNEFINVTVYYKDNITKQHLSGATVQLIGWDNFTEINNQYSITVDTDDLDLGITVLSVFAQLDNYQSKSIQFFIEKVERETELLLFLDDVPKNDKDKIQVQANEFINVTVYYKDNITKQHLSGATVTLLGRGNLTEISNHYNITVDTDDLDPGITVLTVFAQLDNYKSKSIQFFVEIVDRETELLLFLDNVPKNDKDKIQVQANEFINVTVYYKDNITKQHLSGATVTLLGRGNLTEISNHYNITVDTDDLDPGITVLTVFAQLDNYKSKSIQFFVEIVDRETELLLFLDSVPKNDGDKIQVEVNEFINVTVLYRDNETKIFLSGADVSLLGKGNFTEINNQYNITIDTSLDLDQGITILTIFAQLDKYQPQSIQFFVEVVERESELELFIDEVNITLDPVIETTIKNSLNITIYYVDNQTGLHIAGALVQMIGEGNTIDFNETLNQYSIFLNTTDLKIGVNLFTIVAHANNFQIRTIDLRITVDRIKVTTSTLSGEPYVTGLKGDSVRLRIILNNTNVLPSGELIKNATVTYKWAYGQGEILDPENDGIYEVDLVNVPFGTYIVTITASAGDDYDFESYEITLSVNVRQRWDPTWLIFTLMGAFGALIIGFVSYEKRYKYPPMVRKMRKLRKKIRKGKKTKPITVIKREDLIKNQLENKRELSNLESIQLEKNQNNFKNIQKINNKEN